METNNKRIAKNTLLLYFRMLLLMGVSLYTVRVVLNTLGTVDYGIYSVVGGIVTMFSFLSNTMASASQRFFSYELGRGNYEQLKKTFSMTMTIYAMIALVILILAETVGLWFLNNKMTIPAERMEAANWVYQFSILSFMMTMITIPFNAAIIAHERMNVYAWVSIVEVLLKLLVVYLLVAFSIDKLKLYAILIFGVTTLVTFIYRSYCIRKFNECRFSFYWNKKLFKEILSFSGWNLFGALAGIFNNNGINIVLNMFFGPIVNTARAVAYQVNSSTNQFVQNFMTASRPQITKLFASGEQEQMMKLVFQSSKFSYILLFILSMPVLLETHFIFKVWLNDVPEYVVLFTRLIIIGTLIDSTSYALQTAAQATGKIVTYQAVVGGMMILNLPLAYLLLRLGHAPQSVFYLSIANSAVCLFLRLYMLSKMIHLSVSDFAYRVLLPLFLVTIIAYIAPLTILMNLDMGFSRFFIILCAGFISSISTIFFIGLTKNEKQFALQTVKNFKKKYVQKNA
ncbi:MAG: polysaccharide biosynthesis protein [Bacteroidetes bacterium]|nr:polysaccharide biosynthesis protein [Bacteroidota bacterium]